MPPFCVGLTIFFPGTILSKVGGGSLCSLGINCLNLLHRLSYKRHDAAVEELGQIQIRSQEKKKRQSCFVLLVTVSVGKLTGLFPPFIMILRTLSACNSSCHWFWFFFQAPNPQATIPQTLH